MDGPWLHHLATSSQGGLFTNSHDLAFVLEVQLDTRSKARAGRERAYVRYRTILGCKRYPESQDCAQTDCELDDPFCKCAWNELYLHQGSWGQPLPIVIRGAVEAADRLARCRSCHIVTAWTPDRTCFTCTLQSYLPRADPVQCPICQNQAICQAVLGCGHALCSGCARRLHYNSTEFVRCPCCRREHTKASVATRLPPTCCTDLPEVFRTSLQAPPSPPPPPPSSVCA